MNLADLLPTVRELSIPQKLTLIEALKSDLNSANVTEWDLSAPEIYRRNTKMLDLIDKWEAEGDAQVPASHWQDLPLDRD